MAACNLDVNCACVDVHYGSSDYWTGEGPADDYQAETWVILKLWN